MTLSDLLKRVGSRLVNLEDPGREALALLKDALDLDSATLFAYPEREVGDFEVERVFSWASRRAEGVPLSYLSGRRGFYESEFLVYPGVLVPRPDSELIIDVACRRAGPCTNLADLGCGTGCLGLSLLKIWPGCRLWAVVRDPVALGNARANAHRLELIDRVEVVEGALPLVDTDLRFDVIVANPPYIAPDDPYVDAGVRKFEPGGALFAGEQGLADIRRWAGWAAAHLRPGGLFVCEFGRDQGASAREIFAAHFLEIEVDSDVGGRPRVVSGKGFDHR